MVYIVCIFYHESKDGKLVLHNGLEYVIHKLLGIHIYINMIYNQITTSIPYPKKIWRKFKKKKKDLMQSLCMCDKDHLLILAIFHILLLSPFYWKIYLHKHVTASYLHFLLVIVAQWFLATLFIFAIFVIK